MIIRCPQCKEEGHTQLEEGRHYFSCPTCLYHCLLKVLNINYKKRSAILKREELPVQLHLDL